MCAGDSPSARGDDEETQEEREEEEKRLDRAWYGLDDGYDKDTQAPFSGMSDEYTKKKEIEHEQRKKKKMSAQQRQINKVCTHHFLT